MKSHLVAVRICFPDIIDKSRFMHVACPCFIQEYTFGFILVYRNGNTTPGMTATRKDIHPRVELDCNEIIAQSEERRAIMSTKAEEKLTFANQENSILPQKRHNRSLICLHRSFFRCIGIDVALLLPIAMLLSLGRVGRWARWFAWSARARRRGAFDFLVIARHA
jgi:hypothetical protein